MDAITKTQFLLDYLKQLIVLDQAYHVKTEINAVMKEIEKELLN